MADPSPPITDLLQAWGRGDPDALTRLTPLVYVQLRRLAASQMRKERGGHSLQTTALVHEAYLRLIRIGKLQWQDRAHFFAVSARIMRRILVDGARARCRVKRGGGAAHEAHDQGFDFDQMAAPDTERSTELCALDDALVSLAGVDPRRAQVVEMRFFGGLSVDETAEILSVSPQTVMRDWRLARAWLTRELNRPSGAPLGKS
jgi:RNA polymerase sigma factor (TIGR02999 family)